MKTQKDNLTDVVDVLQGNNNNQSNTNTNNQSPQSSSSDNSNEITVEGSNGQPVTLGNDTQINK